MAHPNTPIPLSVPQIEGNAWKYVKNCLDTHWVSSVGRYVGLFEQSVARYAGARHAVACVNGTAGLHLALSLCDVGPGDAVLTPALTFIATANAVSYTGATCVFLDCEPRRFNLDLDRLEEFLDKKCRRAKKSLLTRNGLRVKAILPAHILGYPIDMKRLTSIARRHRLALIEDAAESVGSFWDGRHTGTFGQAGILSFNGNKIITTGGGGMILTNDAAMAKRARHLTQQAKAGEHEYIHDAVGYNYRLTNILAALGVAQMESLPKFLRKRRIISSWYARRLKTAAPLEPVEASAVWNRWLLSVQTDGKRERDRILALLERHGCQARLLWRPVPLQKPYLSHPSEPIPESQRAYETVVNIPSSTSLTEAQVDRVAGLLKDAGLTRLLA